MIRIAKVAVAGLLLSTLGLVSPASAVTTEQIREGDFVASMSDTRSGGDYEFLAEGLAVTTQSNTSVDKVAEYWLAASDTLPGSLTLDWNGTQPEPGTQIRISAPNGTGGILVGEAVYGGDFWLNGGQANAAAMGLTCPSTTGGSGSDCHGTLAAWEASAPETKVVALGFSLGSGVKGDGVIRSVTADDTQYVFTSDPALSPATPQGWYDKDRDGRKVVFTFGTDEQPENTYRVGSVRWTYSVDGVVKYRTRDGFGEFHRKVARFERGTGKHMVVLANQYEAIAAIIRTGRS